MYGNVCSVNLLFKCNLYNVYIYVINSTICRLHLCENTVYNHYSINYKDKQCSVNQRDDSIIRDSLR